MRSRFLLFLIIAAVIITLAPVPCALAGDFATWLKRGQELAQAGKIDEAIAAFDVALEKDGRAPEGYYNRALAYEALDNHEKAAADLSKAIDLRPNYVDAYFERGNVYFSMSAFWQAVRDYTRVLELDPAMAKAYYTRGYAYMLLKDKEYGLADIRKAARMGHEPAKVFLKSNGVDEK